MADVQAVLKAIGKEHGTSVATKGFQYISAGRIPTGIFAFDLATGGGIPRGRVTTIYGKESSCKTTLALQAIASNQLLNPEEQNVFIDLEGHFDPDWASTVGVNVEELIYVQPDYAEQAVDIIEAFLYADDIGIIVVDSLAAFISANETESSAEKAVVGGSGLIIGKYYRKASLALAKARKLGKNPAIININQVRMKIGGHTRGDPEVQSGGNAFKFGASLIIRVAGYEIMDTKVHGTLPAYKEISGVIKKQKVGVLAKSFKYQMLAVNHPNGAPMGSVYDWNTVVSYLKQYGMLVKEKDWLLNGETYRVIDDIKTKYDHDPAGYLELKQQVIAKGLTLV